MYIHISQLRICKRLINNDICTSVSIINTNTFVHLYALFDA
ncbi:hypothetical protein MACK_003947 [Theileria orientalis]|uniref:Uncharacterized protein n=1 Tax=Theileria orientalis TaxID=68886 RepID=A0A976XI32_THEOR|nr:hypothetical protein MACK_003947 [Theileria orientalis]